MITRVRIQEKLIKVLIGKLRLKLDLVVESRRVISLYTELFVVATQRQSSVVKHILESRLVVNVWLCRKSINTWFSWLHWVYSIGKLNWILEILNAKHILSGKLWCSSAILVCLLAT